MNGEPGFHDLREEILERVWTMAEEGEATLAPLLDLGEETEIRARVYGLEKEGLLKLAEERVSLTQGGEAVARHVVRAHGLAARLMTDLLELPPDGIENLACRLEHAISPELADSLCILLGHPPTGPAGRPIPRGACCEGLKHEVGPVVRQLQELDLGTTGRITFIHPRFVERLDQLSALGLVPGTEIRLTQHLPSIVVQVGETTLALDTDVARDVFVKPIAS